MPNGDFPKLPKFPTTFTEAEAERARKLEEQRKVVEAAYKGHFAPGKWGLKSAWEKAARTVAMAAYIPEWAGRKAAKIWESITPWTEVGFTPEQSDVIKQEMEAELFELRRQETIVERLPKIKSYMETLALLGKLTGEEAQLYELLPELDPSKASSLGLDERERGWFLEYNRLLAGATREGLLEGIPFPSPENYEELMEQFEVLAPRALHDPKQAFATVSFIKDYEEIAKAIKEMYPAKEGGRTPEELAQDDVWKEMWERGLSPTGNIEEDIKLLEESILGEREKEGEPYAFITEDGTIIPLTKWEDGIYSEGTKVANVDPDTGKAVPLTEAEEYEISNAPPSGDKVVQESLLRSVCPGVSDTDVKDFFTSDTEDVELWYEKYRTRFSTPMPKLDWVLDKLVEIHTKTYPPPDLVMESLAAWRAGVGDVIATSGGAARWMGADGIAESLTKAGDNLQAMAFPDDLGDFHWKLLFNPRFWALRGTRVAPFTLSLLPAAVAGYYAGAAIAGIAAVKLGLGVFGTKIVVAIAGGLGGAIVSRPLESAMEAGAAYDRAKSMGASDEEADAIADEVFINNLKLVGLDAAQIATAFAPVSLKVGANLITKGLVNVARVGGRMFIVGLTEAGEEAFQEAVTRQAMGEEDPWRFDPEMQQVMALGGAMGLGMGAGGDVLSHIIGQTKENMTPTQKKKFDTDVGEVGEAEALDRFTETPEGAKLVGDIVKVVEEQEFNREIREAKVAPEEVPIMPEVYLQETLTTYGKKFDFIVDNKIVGSVDYREIEGLGKVGDIEGIMIVDIEVIPEMKRKGIASKVLDKIISEAEAQDKILYSGVLKPEGQLWLEGLEKRGVIKLEKQEQKLLGYSITRAEVAEPTAPEVTPKPLVRKKIHTKEIKFYQDQLANTEGEIKVAKKSHKNHSERLERLKEAKAPAYDIAELQEVIKGVESLLGELNTKKADLKTKMETLGEVIPEVVPPAVEVIGALQAVWDTQSLLEKVASANKAGIAKATAKLSWNELTDVQRGRLEAATTKEPVITKEKVEELSPEALSEGKAIDKEIAEEQSRSLEGLPERTVDVDTLEQLREAAEDYFDKQLYGAIPDNNLSKALVAAQKLGDTSSYVKYLDRLPKTEAGGIDWDANISQEFKDAEFDDASMPNLNSMPFVDACAYIDKGLFGGALRMGVYQIGDQALVANFGFQGGWGRKLLDAERVLGLDRPSWWKFRRKAAWNEMLYAIADSFSSEDVTVDANELLQREEVSEAVKKFSEKRHLSSEQQLVVIDYAKLMRMNFDEIWAELNTVRAVLGREPIEYIKNYLPEVYKTNIWGRFLGIHLKPSHLHKAALAPDFIKPSAPFNPRELERKGGLAGYEKVTDVRRLFLDYIAVAGREMFFTPAINNAKAHARYLRNEKGLDVPAKYVEDRFMETMAGVPESGSRWSKETLPPWIMRPLWAVRRRLNPAVFGLNPKWNLFIQTSSMALLPLKGVGVKSGIKGLQYIWNPAARTWVEDNVPASIIKERGRGSIIHQDVGTTLTEARRADMSPMETVDEWVTFLTRKLERLLTGISAYAGCVEGQRRGITDPAKLVAFASDVATTQSMYDPFHMPGAYSPMIRFFVPFQTFCFEALTKVREMSGIKKIAAGAYVTVAADSVEGKSLIRNRAKYFLEFMAAIFLVNVAGELFNRRKPWEWSSFVPAVNIMMYGVDPTNPWNKPFLSQYGLGLWKSFDAIIEYGNWKPLTYWATKWHLPAGFQAKKMMEGIAATIEGAHEDVSGEVMFELEEGEWLKAVTLGVWSTESGEEWIKTHMEGEDPTTQKVIKDIEKLKGQLGTGVKGKYYTLSKYRTDSINLIRKNKPDEPLWRILESTPIYPPLTLFAMHCEVIWEDYYDTPGEDRIAYRRANPYIDATLVFWEKVQNPRSDEGKKELGELFKEFGIDENPRWHYKGLPQIPDEFIGIPE